MISLYQYSHTNHQLNSQVNMKKDNNSWLMYVVLMINAHTLGMYHIYKFNIKKNLNYKMTTMSVFTVATVCLDNLVPLHFPVDSVIQL